MAEIDSSLLLGLDDNTDNPVDYKGSTKVKSKAKLKSEQDMFNTIALANRSVGPTTSVTELAPIDSYWEKGETLYDLKKGQTDYLANQQGYISKIGNSLGQGLGTFLTATLSTGATLVSGIAGGIGQTIDAVTGEDNTDFMDTALSNPLTQGISELDKYIKNDLLPTYYTQEQQQSLLSASTGTELINGLGFMLSAMFTGGAVTKALGGISKLGTMAKLGTLEANVAKSIATGAMKAETGATTLALGKFMSKVPAVTGAVVGRIGESAMEANQTYESLIANGVDEETAKKQRDNVFYGNMALAMSDVAQYTRWFKPNPFERIIKNVSEKGVGYAVKQIGKKETIAEILKESSQEAGEEGLQYLFQKGAEKAAKEPGKYSFGSGALNSVGELFTTTEGQKSMLLGAILGGGVGTVLKSMNSKQVNAQLQSTVDELNANPTFSNEKFIKNAEGKYVLNPEFVKSQTIYANLEAKREEAIANGDLESAELIEKLQFNNLVASRVAANKFDDLIEELQVMGQATDAELEQYFGQIPTDKYGDKMSASQIASAKIEEAKALKRNIESLRLIPQFQNLSTSAFNMLTEITIRQDAINKQIQEVDKQIVSIIPNSTTRELSAPDKVRLDNLTETREALVNQYTKLNKTLEFFTAKPEKLEKKADEIAEKTAKAFEKQVDKELEISNEADEVIENGIKNGTSLIIKNSDGTIKFVTYQDGVYVEENGTTVEEAEVKQGVINELNEQNEADVIDTDIDEVDNTVNYSIKKPNIHSSSTQGHNFKKNSNGTIDRTEKQKETTVAGKIIYQLNGLFRKFIDYASKALNTPLVRTATSQPVTYSFVATIGEVTDEELESINNDRIFFAKENNVKLLPVTREDLINNSAFIPISLQLQANGKNVDGAVTRMHNPDYIYRTQEFDAIMKNENIVDKQAAIDSLLEQYTNYRKQLIDKINTGQKVNLLVDTKSGGIMNVTPMVDGKMQVNPITDTFKHINEYESGLYVDNVQLIPNGIGVVTEVDEHGNGTIEFTNGNKGIVSDATLGEMIFQTIDAGANIVNIRALSKNKLSDEQLHSLVDLIYYKLSIGENTITVNGKEHIIVGNQSIGRGIVDSLILLTARQNKEKQIFFKKNGSLVVGRKEFTFEDKPETVIQAIYEALLAGNNEVNFKKDIKSDSDFILPQLNEDGTWTGKTTTYNKYIFGGEQPLIGTFVDSETPFINSYYSYKMDDNGYVTDPIEETKPEPIYPIVALENKLEKVDPVKVNDPVIESGAFKGDSVSYKGVSYVVANRYSNYREKSGDEILFALEDNEDPSLINSKIDSSLDDNMLLDLDPVNDKDEPVFGIPANLVTKQKIQRKANSSQIIDITDIQKNMKQDADESIKDCNGKSTALPDGKNLSGKANKYKKK